FSPIKIRIFDEITNFFKPFLIPNSRSGWVREDLFAGYDPTQPLGRIGPIRWVQLYSIVG
ncbi:MAG: hypothetical protein HXN41_09615, partial [Prevotella histicola]|uniref:hypothetical protein n=1 Tax=Prevotella histicola TaxID=470565 RepID=UPI001CB58D9D